MKLNTKLAALPLAGVMALGLVACSSDSDTAATTTTTVKATTTTTMAPMTEKKDIVDTAVAAGSFKTLAAALTAADLVDTLKGDGPFTVFAPTDDAFAKLPAGTLDSLLLPENKSTLSGILTYHVVNAEAMSSSLTDGQKVKTVNGGELTIGVKGGKVTVTDAKGGVANVVTADIEASNGVIHVIDSVLMP
jgi:uncharacterized surface protein with fasciclin (FAS1) repeats